MPGMQRVGEPKIKRALEYAALKSQSLGHRTRRGISLALSFCTDLVLDYLARCLYRYMVNSVSIRGKESKRRKGCEYAT